MTRKVLLVDDDLAVREALGQTLELANLDAITAGSFIEAKDHISPDFDGVIVSDIRMPGRDGFHLLGYTHDLDAELPVILLTGEGDIPMAVSAMGKGAFDFLEKPCAPKDLVTVIERALHTRTLVLENRQLKAQLETGDPAARMLFGSSDKVEGMRARVRNVARTSAEVLVTGAPGTGISKVAEVVHLCSPLSKGPFGKQSSAMDVDRFEKAVGDAIGGSLFLDEITAMPMDTQFALMNLMEQDGHPRLIFGSTADLGKAVEQGLLHADLFYRLDAMQVRIPSLAERPEDIPILFRQYVSQAAEHAGLRPPEVTSDLVANLMARDWPGNARALMSIAMRFALGLLDSEEEAVGGLGLVDQMAQVERSLLQEALRRAGGRASVAAETLKLPRKTFYDKLSKHGLKPEEFR